MKLAFVGDLHIANHRQYGGELEVGMNARCRAVLAAVAQAVAHANSQGCTDLVILGDVFDTPKPLPQQLTALRATLCEFQGAVHVIVGNHDRVSSKPGDHGLGPLAFEGPEGAQVTVYDTPSRIGDSQCSVLLCPFDERPVLEWLPAALELDVKPSRLKSWPRLVCGHFGLYQRQQTAEQPWLAGAHDAVEVEAVAQLLAAHDVKELYVGNYHTWGQWQAHGVTLHQVGALVPTGFDNPGWSYGRVETWPSTGPGITVVSGPRFVVVTSLEELEEKLEERGACQLFVDWRCSPEEFSEAQSQARRVEPGAVVIDVHVDHKFVKLRAAAAAGAARSAETLDAVVAAYVEKCALPPQVSRDNVMAHAKRFLRC